MNSQVRLWFDTKEELINYLNKGQDRDKVKIASFDYFGHSNKACFLFDYSNTIDTMSIAYLHVKDLRRIEVALREMAVQASFLAT